VVKNGLSSLDVCVKLLCWLFNR